jgi:hypothetical protein
MHFGIGKFFSLFRYVEEIPGQPKLNKRIETGPALSSYSSNNSAHQEIPRFLKNRMIELSRENPELYQPISHPPIFKICFEVVNIYISRVGDYIRFWNGSWFIELLIANICNIVANNSNKATYVSVGASGLNHQKSQNLENTNIYLTLQLILTKITNLEGAFSNMNERVKKLEECY